MQPHLLLAQLNPVVGDISANAQKILDAYKEAKPGSIVVCPELSLIGYPPEDLLLMPAFRAMAMQEARNIAAATTEAGLVFGTAWEEGGALYNAAIFASNGRINHIHYKMMLPNYGVFDEKRYFSPGHTTKSFEWNGSRMAIVVCEDIWHVQFAEGLGKQHPELIIVVNASPFETGKLAVRHQVVARAAQLVKTPIAYINLCGGQDDIVFDGGSFIMNAEGYVTAQAPQFAVGIFSGEEIHQPMDEDEQIWNAMKTGLSDYVHKNGFKSVLLGLSGGIDSAVTAAVAVDALGKENVRGVLLPSPYTSSHSNEDALELAKNLGIQTDTIPITPAMQAMEQTLAPMMLNVMEDIAVGGNIQARIRGQILMAISNKTGAMLLSTGNKSEIAVGYTTLYGDSCGSYNCIKDVYKTDVYRLARWRNQRGRIIPERSITKAPSAELAPGQKDSDQLPDYGILDAILRLHIEGRLSAVEIMAHGFDAATVNRVVKLVRQSEYKRRQSAPGVKISSMLFGKDRRFPLTNKSAF
jgi:NAD+ synthetase